MGNPGTGVVSESTGVPAGVLGGSRVAYLTGVRSACPPAVKKLPGHPPTDFPGELEKFLAVDFNYLYMKALQTHKRHGLWA